MTEISERAEALREELLAVPDTRALHYRADLEIVVRHVLERLAAADRASVKELLVAARRGDV